MILVILSIGLGSCSGGETADDGIVVVATTSVLGDIVSSVVGDRGQVEVLIPVGTDAHDFSPSARQTAMISEADVIVANGLNLEEGLADVLDSARADGGDVVELAPLVDPLPFSSHEGHEEEADDAGNEQEGLDPHFWMDPVRVGRAAVALANHLDAAFPDDGWLGRAESFATEMGDLDASIAELLSAVPEPDRKMVTNHDAFGYFAARYGFEVIGVVIPGGSTAATPSSAELAALVEEMEREGVYVVFAETTEPTALAEAVAAELGEEVEVVELFTGSVGGEGSGAETLADMLLTNARLIAGALS